MTNSQAKSELMQIYGMLSEEMKRALDVLMAQADGEYIKKSDMIDWLKDIRHKMKPQNYHTASEFEIAENQIWNLIQMLQMGAFPTVAIPSAEPKWIPVSEELPEKNMACLVAVGKFNLTQMAMYSDLMGTIDHRIFYQGDYGDGNFENITQYVKAWMPLPKPYNPQESDHTCHTCKHYTSGERDGSCDSYICKGYSDWESEE